MFKKVCIAAMFSISPLLGMSNSSVSVQQVSGQETSMADQNELLGRWDLTLDVNGSPAPSWLEVSLSGRNTLVGAYVSIVGSVRPISEIKFENGKFSFTIPPQWEGGEGDFLIEGTLSGDQLEGTVKMSDGKAYDFEGVRAPHLDSNKEVKWGKTVKLFNGKDLDGWQVSEDSQWEVIDGILTSPKAGKNLVSEEKFIDFKMNVEFRVPEHGNSGIYLRGRYEVQITDVPADAYPESHMFSGIYGFLTPNENVAKRPGEWQSYEITLIGRKITIVANGKTVICEQLIPGITGGALDANEGEAGPIYIQGDHTSIEFRKIEIKPAS